MFSSATNLADQGQIAKAAVTLPCSHLPTGLCLVDLPGAEGMSLDFREVERAALATVDTVILVVQDRNAGPALDLARDILEQGITIDAVVINLQMSKFVDTRSLRSLSDLSAGDHIMATRDYVADQFTRELPGFDKDCPFFAFHVPSMTGLSIGPESELSLPSHANEIWRFADWFETANGLEGTRLRLESLLREIESYLAGHKAILSKEDRQLTALSASDAVTLQQLNQSIEAHKADLRETWRLETADGRIKLAAEQAWAQFRPSVTELKFRLQELHRTTTAAVPQGWWSQNRGLAEQVSHDINRAVSSSQKRLESRAAACVQRFSDTITHWAQELAASELTLVPIDRGPMLLEAAAPVSVWSAAEPDPRRKSLSEYDSSKVIERLLDELAVLEMSVSAADGSAMFQAFRHALDSQLEKILEQLESRLDALQDDAGDSSSPLLAEARSRLDEQIQSVDCIEAAISEVRVNIAAFEPRIADRKQQIDLLRAELRKGFDARNVSTETTADERVPIVAVSQATDTADRPKSLWETWKRALAHWLGQGS